MRKIEIKNWHFFHNYVIILSHQNFHNFPFHSQPLKIEYLKRQGWISYKVGKVEISRQEDSIFNIIFRIPRFSDFSVSLAFNFFFYSIIYIFYMYIIIYVTRISTSNYKSNPLRIGRGSRPNPISTYNYTRTEKSRPNVKKIWFSSIVFS